MREQTAVMDVETRPGWEETENEIRYRLREPDAFAPDSFKRITLQEKPPVYAVAGKLKGEKAMTLQALRFPKDAWTLGDAKAWLKDHPEVRKDMQPDDDDAGEDLTTGLLGNSPEDYTILTCAIERAPGEEDKSRVRRFVASTAARDRYGDEIPIDAWDVKHYAANPVFLWAHDYHELPLGVATHVERTDKALVIDVRFAEADANPMAEQVLRLYDDGILRGVSVGFRSLKSEWIDPNDDDEQKRMKKEPDIRPGKRFLKVELLEVSAVPVPANPQALMTARKKGLTIPAARNFAYYHADAIDPQEIAKYIAEHKDEILAVLGVPKAETTTNAPAAASVVLAAKNDPPTTTPITTDGRAGTDPGSLANSPQPPVPGQPDPCVSVPAQVVDALVETLSHILGS